ncbi:MAG: hypothetical protein IPL39_20635 [Opitutaceae bacterium]|nr:hypothetical protein [Opitutaceae bacterium]
MKPRILLGVIALLSLASTLSAGPRDEQWQQVHEAVGRGLPKTAIERLEPIIAGAVADRSYAEAIKAIGRRIALEGVVQGNKPEEKIVRLQAELDKAPAEMKPAMEALLGHWYWQYFQHNRWRFLQRTQTAEAPGPDLQTWDLARILAEIGRCFDAALADPAALQATSIETFDALIDKGSVPDTYRPTLFDFLAYEALSFYQIGEQAAVGAEDAFEIAATGPIFGDVAEFAKWQVDTADTGCPQLKAIRLYQALLQFHRGDTDRSAFHDADLARLNFGYNAAVGEGKDERYDAALRRFVAATEKHEISARAVFLIASRQNSAGELVAAWKTAQLGRGAFPGSAGGNQCFNLIEQIEARSAQLDTEGVWNAPWPTLNITYRNVTRIHLRAVPVDFTDYVEHARWTFGSFERERTKAWLDAKPALAWEAELPPTNDFNEHTEKLPAPTTLKPGFYAIFASHDAAFGDADNQVSVATVWVSDLALVLSARNDSETQAGFVLQAGSGEPVAGATLRFWQRDREGWFKALAPKATDANGRFEFSAKDRSVLVLAEHGGHAVASMRELRSYGRAEPGRSETQTVFFTDRAIYRPGQTISYKGVSICSDRAAAKYSAAAGRALTVVFDDPNGKEIARTEHRTNDYGSFEGAFTAPRDRVAGRMSIQVLDRSGMTFFNVEEYKRPKFQVALEAPTDAAKLDSRVTVVGKATAYTGAAIGGAKVQWRVVRDVQFPSWCWWWRPQAAKAVAHGIAASGPDGTFKVTFTAEPDRAVPAKSEPVFSYTVFADVTDTTGETRSDERTVRAGYTALAASVNAGDWQTAGRPVELSVTTTSLDGVPQAAKGRMTIHALKQPVAVERAPLRRQNRWWWGAEEPKADPANPDSWAQEAVVATQAFKTDATGATKVVVPLKAGIYRASLETKDRFGKTVTARRTVQVVDPRARRYGVKVPNLFAAPKWSVEPGEKFTALWGTGYASGRAFVELECNGKALMSYWTKADRTQEPIEHTVTEEMRGGFTVRVSFVRENRAYFHERVVNVPWTNKQLNVKWETFRSKLAPGQKETWTAVVAGPDARRSAAEMVATLYDASLDQYAPHSWPAGFSVFRYESNLSQFEFQNVQRDLQYVWGWWQTPQHAVDWRYRTFPAEVVSDFWGLEWPADDGAAVWRGVGRKFGRGNHHLVAVLRGRRSLGGVCGCDHAGGHPTPHRA